MARLPLTLLMLGSAADPSACAGVVRGVDDCGVADAAASSAASAEAGAAARAELERLAVLRAGLRSKDSAELPAARRAVIEGYRDLARKRGVEPAVVAECAVRAARLLIDEGRLDEALAEHERAIRHGADSGWRSQAYLEAAHALRRAKRWRPAEEAYDRACGAPHVLGSDRDEALDWRSRLQYQRGAVASAREGWRRLARQSLDPLRRIEAWDRLASQWLDADDLEAAAGELHAARIAFAAHHGASDELSLRIVAALDAMRSLTRAERMVERRWRALQQRDSKSPR
jgi:tetratricopeptide (TPR) repeat protein